MRRQRLLPVAGELPVRVTATAHPNGRRTGCLCRVGTQLLRHRLRVWCHSSESLSLKNAFNITLLEYDNSNGDHAEMLTQMASLAQLVEANRL